jgi:hypothetical protein
MFLSDCRFEAPFHSRSRLGAFYLDSDCTIKLHSILPGDFAYTSLHIADVSPRDLGSYVP